MAVRPECDEESDEEAEVGSGLRVGIQEEKMKIEKEERQLHRLPDPRRPTQAEVDDHNRTHLPYRNWCPHCIRGKGRDLDHRKAVDQERGLSEFSFDYCFPGDEFGFKLTVLVGRERTSGMTMATVIPRKGSSGQFAVDKALEFIAECGCQSGDIIVKSDQEPAIEYLIKDIVHARGDEKGSRTIVEESPVASKGSNGVVERAVQTTEGQIRVMKSALEERVGRKIDAESNVVAFIADYAAYLVSRLEVGKDGKTAYERVRGKLARILGLEFGEKLMFKLKPKLKMEKINPRWEHGIFLGIRRRSGEVWVATTSGVRSARSVRRIPVEDRWGDDCVNWVKHVPWNRYAGAEDADGEIPEEKLVNAREDQERAGAQAPVVYVNIKETGPREFQIRKEDAEKYGYSRGCAGCSSWFRGLGRQPHTDACRRRFGELMKEDARVKNAKKRKEDFDEKTAKKLKEKEAEDKKRKEDFDEKAAKKLKETEENDTKQKKRGAAEIDVPADESAPKRAGSMPGSSEDHLRGTKRAAENGAGAEEAHGHMVVEMVRQSWADVVDSDEDEDDTSWQDCLAGRRDEEAVKTIAQLTIETESMQEEAEEVLADEMFDFEQAWDDVHGKALDITKVRLGRKEEVEYMKSRGIWSEVSVHDCWRKTGKRPVSVKWVDTDKGTIEEPLIRCRLVARDFRVRGEKDREDLFAATPPLELKRMLLSRTACRRKDGRVKKLLFIDVRKAHLNPECHEDVYIELPQEAGAASGMCGKLNHWLYGFRPAAQAWENEYAKKLEEAGFARGKASPVVFWNPERDLSCVVHGDDFTFSGFHEDLIWIKGLMQEWFEIKVRAVMGPEDADDKEVNILGRTVRWKDWGIEYEADKRHRKVIIEYFGFNEKTKGLTGNGVSDLEDEDGEDDQVDGKDATAYRAVAARVNFLSQDCPDLQFPAKEVCRDMATPTRMAWKRLKRLARYLISRRAVVYKLEWQEEGSPLKVYTDSDWAGCRRTRKSTSGGVVMVGCHCLKSWSSTQGPLALSSAEAEYYSMVEGTLRAKGIQTMGREIGMSGLQEAIILETDSSAAKSFAARRGLGKMRHMEARHLWLQGEVLKKNIKVLKVKGEENPADLMTKYLSEKDVAKHLRKMNIEIMHRDSA